LSILGAGKTTLLNALARRAEYAKVTGSVKFAGRKMTPTDLTYVPQFDQLNRVMTIQEHFELVGKLSCADAKDMYERLEIILLVLGLKGKRHTPVGKLSGGEVKRVSIGVGLISKPNVLFLDEPTTGLDSTSSYSIVKYLVILAKTTNIAIIMTIHQPSALVFSMLDDLLLLETGRIVYGGGLEHAVAYFNSHGYTNPDNVNPAEYYLVSTLSITYPLIYYHLLVCCRT
jgi:ABC-type multidrug transport system ATPase subunit